METNVSEALLNLLVSGIGDYAIYMIDPSGYILSWNKGAEKIKGYKEAEITGKHFSIFYSVEDQENHVPEHNLDEAIRLGRCEREGWRIRSDGSPIWANIIITPIFNERGEHVGFAKVTRDLTEQKELEMRRAQEKARRQDERFRALIENSYDGITLLDSGMNVIYRSKAAQKIIGQMVEPGIRVPIRELIHPDDRNAWDAVVLKLSSGDNRPLLITLRSRHGAGHYLWLECIFTNHLNDPDIKAIVCNFRDITQKIIADEQLSRLLNTMDEVFFVKDVPANRLLQITPCCNDVFGYSQEEMIAFPEILDKVVYPADLPLMQSNYPLYRQGQRVRCEYRIVCKDKSIHWVEGKLVPHLDENGDLKYLYGVIQGISERKAAERTLMQSEANLRSVFENTDLCIVLLDAQLDIVAFNKNAYDLSLKNYNKPLSTGQPGLGFFPDDRQLVMRQMADKALAGEAVAYEVFYEFSNKLEWYEVKWRHYQIGSDESRGVILTFRDVTERKEREQERSSMTAELVRKNQGLEQYAYIVSHNLRAPVANIAGLTHILSTVAYDPTEQAEVFQKLSSSVGKLDDVIQDLNMTLELTRDMIDQIEDIDLEKLVRDIIESVPQLTAKNDIVFRFNLRTRSVVSVKSYLYSIMQHLIINAIKYRRPDILTEIIISSSKGKNRTLICVKDNGKGIDLNRYGGSLFGLYKRFDNTVKGKGFGLFMVKTLMETLGGNIRVESKPGRGSKFVIELPTLGDNER